MPSALETTLLPLQSHEPPEEDDTFKDRVVDFFQVHDTEGFVAANDDIVLVVFRGTSEGKDWITNLRGIPFGVPDTWNVPKGCSMHRVSGLTLGQT